MLHVGGSATDGLHNFVEKRKKKKKRSFSLSGLRTCEKDGMKLVEVKVAAKSAGWSLNPGGDSVATLLCLVSIQPVKYSIHFLFVYMYCWIKYTQITHRVKTKLKTK